MNATYRYILNKVLLEFVIDELQSGVLATLYLTVYVIISVVKLNFDTTHLANISEGLIIYHPSGCISVVILPVTSLGGKLQVSYPALTTLGCMQ